LSVAGATVCFMGVIPVRPAAYVRDIYADPGDESGLEESRRLMSGWPARPPGRNR
jgi:hypothetical protein